MRLLIFAIILLVSLYFLSTAIGNLDLTHNRGGPAGNNGPFDPMSSLPHMSQISDCQLVDHKYFNLCYNEAYEQAAWAGYLLTRRSLEWPNVKRTDWYTEDEKVSTRSAHHRDYIRSGYTRGHLVPAADMAFNERAMTATFNMSNISPQLSGFNGGIWRELEESVRDWAIMHDTLYVVTGPVIGKTNKWIGKTSQVAVPAFFFKAIMNDNWESIAFLVPHEISAQPLMRYAISVDSLEEFAGLEIFDELLDDEIELAVEEHFESELWPVNATRYQQRIEKWNNR